MDVLLDPTIFFWRYQYYWSSLIALQNCHTLLCFQSFQEYRCGEIYQTLLYEKIYSRFVFLPKKASWYLKQKHVAKNNGLSWQYDWPFHGFPFLHEHANRK